MTNQSPFPDPTTEGSDALEEGLRRFQARDLEGAHLAFERAARSIARGIESWPDHEGLRPAKEAVGWRRHPALELSPLSLGMPSLPHQE